MERFVGRFKQLAWFLPGFLLWAAFPPMGERMDVLFALAPLIVHEISAFVRFLGRGKRKN